ncbi:hypothetical protein GCK32_022217 [Trichostrongylus colubriformis]|uniref:ShKT domain-containing protein n=1 Tax=Trichostrongylus colubriformis TaxID=6319 RepID=A0AAN8IP70_TRICO
MFFYILCALFLANTLAANTTALNNTATPAPCKDDERMTEICETVKEQKWCNDTNRLFLGGMSDILEHCPKSCGICS